MLRLVIGVIRCLGLLFFYAALVLFVPSSAWAASTEQPSSSASPSPSDGSSSPPPTDTLSEPPASSEPPTTDPSPSATEPAPTVTETVTETASPEPVQTMGTEADPSVVRLDAETTALVLLLGCITSACLGLIAVSSFRS